jgi:hypothetical protein
MTATASRATPAATCDLRNANRFVISLFLVEHFVSKLYALSGMENYIPELVDELNRQKVEMVVPSCNRLPGTL